MKIESIDRSKSTPPSKLYPTQPELAPASVAIRAGREEIGKSSGKKNCEENDGENKRSRDISLSDDDDDILPLAMLIEGRKKIQVNLSFFSLVSKSQEKESIKDR